LNFETRSEQQALECLAQATNRGALNVIAEADGILNRALSGQVAPDLRERILELAEGLFQSIGMQLSVAKYKAIAVDRGAALDTLDYPLNNRFWLKEQFTRIRRLPNDSERAKALQRIVDWENPGPGGFYDDLGNVARQPHLVRPVSFEQDPGGFVSPRIGYEEDLAPDEDEPPPQGVRRFSWLDHAETLYDAPLQVRYTGLDPQSHYKLRVVYAGDTNRRKIRLVANEGLEVHSYLARPVPFAPLEFDLPAGSTQSGVLTLSWSGEPGLGGNGRGCQVSEVWLMKKAP
jgi:hypothetical protein